MTLAVKDGAGASTALKTNTVASEHMPNHVVVDPVAGESVAKAEDVAHASGDYGFMALAVRRDTAAAVAADGDYIPLIVDSTGKLHTADANTATLAAALKAEDAASANGDAGLPILTVRKDTPAATSGADGDYQPPISGADGRLHVAAASDRLISAAGTTLTRPANTTPYTAGDSISDNATAGSVTALSVTVSDTNDAPVSITEIELDTNDTGLAAGGVVDVFVYNSDPTASSGIVAGDNAAFSVKKAGFRARFRGTFTAFSDGGKATCRPVDGDSVPMPMAIVLPGSGAKTLWYVFKAVTGFNPSANSTTIATRLKGFQGRA
jgi:hypothetical protein